MALVGFLALVVLIGLGIYFVIATTNPADKGLQGGFENAMIIGVGILILLGMVGCLASN